MSASPTAAIANQLISQQQQQQQQQQPTSPSPAQPQLAQPIPTGSTAAAAVSGGAGPLETSRELMQRLCNSTENLSADDRASLARLLTDTVKENRILDAKMRTLRENTTQTSKLFNHFLHMLLPQTEAGGDEERKLADKLVSDDPNSYMSFMMPKMIKASARLSQQPQQQQFQQPPQQQIQPPIPQFDPQLWAQYQSFQEVMNGYNTVQDQPRTMYASNNNNKRSHQEAFYGQQQQQRAGAGGWIQNSGLMPSTVAIFNETQAASMAGFGDTMRLADVTSTGLKRQFAPPSSELDQLAGSR